MIRWIADAAWRWLRGVHTQDHFHGRCARCGFSGVVHYTGFYPCQRFVPLPKEDKRCTR